MAPRARWKGHLRLSLVSCPVALYTATTTSGRIRLNIINRETGNRVRYEVVDADTGEPVPSEERVKGYRIDRGSYVVLDDEELERIAIESTHTIDIEAFVPRAEVDDLYLDESYFIAPVDRVGAEAFAVIREAMAKEGLVGLARIVLSRREQILMLEPRGPGMMATTLRYAEEVRGEDAYFEDIPEAKVSKDMLDLAIHILKGKTTRFDPAHFTDRYEEALGDLIKAKRGGRDLPEPPDAPPSNVVSLMDALRRSIDKRSRKEDGDKPGTARSSGAKSARGKSGTAAPAAKTRKAAKAKTTASQASKRKSASAKRASTGRGGSEGRLKKAG